MQMKKLLILLTTLLFSVSTFAGLVQPAPVMVDIVNGSASGDMRTARNSKNDVEFIGCGIRVTDAGVGGVFHYGFCQAADAEGIQVTCFTQNVDLLATLDTISDSSYITYGFTEVATDVYDCTRIGTSTQSFYLEKGKAPK